MPWTNPQRNLDENIKFGALRKDIDLLHAQIHDALSAAYYDYWRQGVTHEVTLGPYSFDKQSTPEETLAYWNQLQRALTHYYTLYFHDRNLKQPPPKRIPESAYRYTYVDSDADPLVVDEDLVAIAAAQCVDLRDNHGIDFSDFLTVDIDAF